MSTYTDGGSVMSLSRQESYFADKSTTEVVDEFTKRWELAKSQVENLLESADQTIGKGAYPIVPQTIVGIVANIFGFTPRNGLAESELHSKAEALPGKPAWQMSEELTRTR